MIATLNPPARSAADPSQQACVIAQDLFLEALRRGDPEALRRMVDENHPLMFAVAKRFMYRDADAEDAVQDAFASALKALRNFRADCRLSTWLHRITVNACLMRLRVRARERRFLDTFRDQAARRDPNADAGGRGVCEAVCLAELREDMQRCIRRLPPSYRLVIQLRDIEEFDTRTTASMLGCSAANVKTRLHRARQGLHHLLVAHLEDHGTAPHPRCAGRSSCRSPAATTEG